MAIGVARDRRVRWRLPAVGLPRPAILMHWIVVPLAIMALGWSAIALDPAPGLDESWVASLYMGLGHGLTFGRDVVFTYGPLGFLDVPALWQVHLAQVAVAYTLVLRFGVALALYHGLRHTFGSVWALVISVVLVCLGVGLQLGELVVFAAAALWAIQAEPGDRRVIVVVIAGAAFAGLELLAKVSVGASVALMMAVMVVSLPGPRWRYAGYAVAAFVISLLAFWLIAGQPLTALPSYLRYSVAIASGYTPADVFEGPGLGWEYSAAFFGLALGLWAAWRAGTLPSSRQRWGLAALWLVFWFAIFKEGFVKHDAPHGAFFFLTLLGGFAVLRWPRGERAIAAAGLTALAVLTLAAQSRSLDLRLGSDVKALVDNVSDVISTSKATTQQQLARLGVKDGEPRLDATTLRLLAGHTVAVYPDAQDIAWAYNLNWDPIPVLQSYAAYTSSLDDLDAKFLSSPRAPTRILYQGTLGFGYQVGAFDESATLRTMLCRYRPLYIHKGIAVLALVENRCATSPTRLGVVHASWGQPVTVPPPPTSRSLVYVNIDGTAASGLESLRSLVWKPAERHVSINGGTPLHFIQGTATDGLPLRLSPGVDWPQPLSVAVGADTMAISKNGAGSGGKPLTYTFYAQTIGPYRR